jgi:hypothetical protein
VSEAGDRWRDVLTDGIAEILQENGEAVPANLRAMLLPIGRSLDDCLGSEFDRWIRCLEPEIRELIKVKLYAWVALIDTAVS